MTDLPPGYGEIAPEDCCNTCGYIHVRHTVPTCRHYTPDGPLPSVEEMADGLRAAVQWIENEATVYCSGAACKPPTLIRSWSGSSYQIFRCKWCRERGTCPTCHTGHDKGVCEVAA